MEVERLSGVVQKGWGYELIWATNDKYCGKIMGFAKKGNKFSMHFHHEKDAIPFEEIWSSLVDLLYSMVLTFPVGP